MTSFNQRHAQPRTTMHVASYIWDADVPGELRHELRTRPKVTDMLGKRFADEAKEAKGKFSTSSVSPEKPASDGSGTLKTEKSSESNMWTEDAIAGMMESKAKESLPLQSLDDMPFKSDKSIEDTEADVMKPRDGKCSPFLSLDEMLLRKTT